MDIKDFANKSQNYIAGLISKSSFNLEDRARFGVIKEEIELDGKKFPGYFFKTLTGYKPNNEVESPILYTFFVIKQDEEVKKKYLEELGKKRAGSVYDEKVVGEYFQPVFPGRKDFEELLTDLTKLLENGLWKEKGYQFQYHLVCPTDDNDFAIVFLELGSVDKLDKQYEGVVDFLEPR